MRAGEAVRALCERAGMGGEVGCGCVVVVVAGEDDQREGEEPFDVDFVEADAAEAFGIGFGESRLGIPPGVAGAGRHERVVRLQAQKAVDELGAGGMAPEERLGAGGDAGLSQQFEDAGGDGVGPCVARADLALLVADVAVIVGA